MVVRSVLVLLLGTLIGLAETVSATSTNGPSTAVGIPKPEPMTAAQLAERSESIRNACIEGRRIIAGRVVQVTAEGLVVDSGYRRLLSPPFNQSWVTPGTASVPREAKALEENSPNALCIGLVLLSNIPKKPKVKNYDYVMIHGYPAGEYSYVPVPGIEKTIRRFSAGLESAVRINLERERR